uniref:Uncharacterized protein n=1 Tax=Anguilla anguilla TaxID=7936 RepID=A0A0E9SAM1_ANGAN
MQLLEFLVTFRDILLGRGADHPSYRPYRKQANVPGTTQEIYGI